MPRLVRLHHTGPIKVEPREKPISICACGLSRSFPLCDGSHKAIKVTETDADALYVYDPDRLKIVQTLRDVLPTPVAVVTETPGPMV